ncbi:TonB-dependent receptor plug domain-containing protein [Pseudomarimonas arenosa]|uniref:TonB-dependent receptor plug domain-containing protein n=1 Tax=Pseudomarimonas arenosa TaxID=2774145 RepID=A0AAW3ZMS2_9GAMM|nr:TonB-dependent receptor plug domain-containing protein [Pseudomarimonas arenosa]MBD8527371.1 TonB-dependent receptor plug domain-containing protein [Pseudomarimonas arenosa]
MRWQNAAKLSLLSLALAGPAAAEQDFMALSLEELMGLDISVASRVASRVDRQPSSVTIIDRSQLAASGARTLSEALMLFVPGYFLVEDQDDTIAGMRGLAPDNNSKIMFMLDGRSLNADWFWGPPDALLNGLDLEFIERVEVIRGPGSVTQGQGALLAVVNIVTAPAADTESRQQFAFQFGEFGRLGASWQGRFRLSGDGYMNLYLSDGEFEGQAYRNEGLGQQVEQGISVYERNHHLKRGDYTNALLKAGWGGWTFALQRFDQLRDLYNWRRDREQVRQVLTSVTLSYRAALATGEVNVDLYHDIDDYELRSHGNSRPEALRQLVPGLIMGGHRENRSGLRALWSSEELWQRHRLALGFEYNALSAGHANQRGDNFIVNTQDAVLQLGRPLLNQLNRWVIPKRTQIRSVFVEDFVRLSDQWEAFLAARWDSHPDWGSKVSPRIGMLWSQSETSLWRLSVQSGFRGAVGVSYSGGFEGDGLLREANFSEVENNPYFAANGNQNLTSVRPEELRSLELAWRWQPSEHWQLNAVGFFNTTRNVIGVGAYFLEDDQARAEAVAAGTHIGSDRIGDWGGVFFFQNNSGELRHRGAEVALEYRRDDLGFRLRASHSHVRVLDADPGQFGSGNIYVTGSPDDPQSRSFPQDVSRLWLHWQPAFGQRRISVDYLHLHYPRWLPPIQIDSDGRPFTPSLDGNSIGNLTLSWRPSPCQSCELSLQLKNVWNATALYPATSVAGEGEGNLGVPGLERRSAWVTLRFGF